MRGAQHEIVLQTPYLVLSKTAQEVFRKQHKERPDLRIVVSTNSLAATDAFFVYALSYKYKKRYLKLGFEIHELKPFPAEAPELIANYETLGRSRHAARRPRTAATANRRSSAAAFASACTRKRS